MSDCNFHSPIKKSLDPNISIDVILLAAGKGERFQNSLKAFNLSKSKLEIISVAKAFLPINQKPIYQYGVDLFSQLSSHIWLVIPKEIPKSHPLKASAKFKSVNGGESRFDSVFNALETIKDSTKQSPRKKHHWILVHDCARVVFDQQDLEQIITELNKNNEAFQQTAKLSGLILATKVTDSIKQKIAHPIHPTYQNLNRDDLIVAQTPQLFKFNDLYEAYQKAKSTSNSNLNTITDEATAIENIALNYQIVLAKKDNFKINTYFDYLLAKQIINLKK